MPDPPVINGFSADLSRSRGKRMGVLRRTGGSAQAFVSSVRGFDLTNSTDEELRGRA